MKNEYVLNNAIQYKIQNGESFSKLICHNIDDIIGFFNETGKFYSILDTSNLDQNVYSVTKNQLFFNLLNIFVLYLKTSIVDFNIENNVATIKVKSDVNYSSSDFEMYHDDIMKIVKNNDFDSRLLNVELSKLGAPFFNCIPYEFKFEKIAQEDFYGYKVQKFTIIAFYNHKEIMDYEERIAQLKLIDHRYIGLQQNLFMMIPESPGHVFWLPNGWRVFRKLEKFIRKYGYCGFNEVKTPFVMSNKFWITSGHMASFKQNMMFVNMGDSNDDDSAIKPMNCPGHIEIFKQKNRSYKELPYRIAEFGCCHRYEPSGSLHGLMRVRSLTIDDGHVFCTREQIHSETLKFLTNCMDVYNKLGFKDVEIVLSTKPVNALGNAEDWDIAEKCLKNSLNQLGLAFKIFEGDGAFYGPKIEMHVKDSLNRSWQLGTIQLDFVLPERFNLEYITSADSKGKVCMLHRAILGSLERFIGVLLEHTGGKLPLFLAPVQINICTIVSDVNEYAKKVKEKLDSFGLYVELDDRAEKIQSKIRSSMLAKIPMIAIIGKQEMKENIVKIQYNGEDHLFKFDEINGIMRFFNEN